MSRRGSGGLGEPSNLRKPLVFGKNAYHLWIALCIMAGVGFVSMILIWLILVGGF